MTSILNRTARVGAIALGALAFALACHAAARADGLPGRPYSVKDAPVQAFSWTGIYVSGGLGYQISNTNVNLDLVPPAPPINLLGVDGFSGKGWTYDARIGADWHIQNTPFVIGLLAGYKGGETDFSLSTGLGGGNAIAAHIHQTWYAGGRAGLAFNQSKSLVYVGYAFTKADFDVSTSGPALVGACTLVKCGHDLDGRMLMLGLETVVMPQVTIGAEYTYTQYDAATLYSGPAPVRLTAEPDVHAFMARVNWRPLGNLFGN
jgi:opacity protein-like surface antigen